MTENKRIIKFRGWDQSENIWRYGYYASWFFSTEICGHVIINATGNGHYYFVKPDSVGQFIGLLDKNEKEIYEGDIMRNGWHESEIGVAEFSDGSFRLGFGYLETICTQAEDCEIIGNIYEDKNLLEDGK
jgi:uncharacterized phage protein (TIGR01671 family)